MTRIIIILFILFLLLTIVRKVLIGYRFGTRNYRQEEINNDKSKDSNRKDISDAKFEEIN